MSFQLFYVFLVGLVGYIIALLSGGGGSLLVLSGMNLLFDPKVTATVINFSETVVRPYRLWLFWQHINWQIVGYYVPFAVVGSWLGAKSLSLVSGNWIKYLVALFLLSTPFQFSLVPQQEQGGFWPKAEGGAQVGWRHFVTAFSSQSERIPQMKLEWFGPLGFVVAYLSALIGATGPVENPFYFNYRDSDGAKIKPVEMVATKTANSFFKGLSRFMSYWVYGLVDTKYLPVALALTVGELVGTTLGYQVLEKISEPLFRRLAIGTMVTSGLAMLLLH